MKPTFPIALALLSALPLAGAGLETGAHADVVLDWNQLLSEVLSVETTYDNPGYASRSTAMMNLAIYDGIAAAEGTSTSTTFYDYGSDFTGTTSTAAAEVAARQAAYTVLSSLYGSQQSTLDAFYNTSLEGPSASTADLDAGVALGTQIGHAIVARRAQDGWDNVVDYTYQAAGTVGAFQADPLNPDVPAWGVAWGQVDTFALSSPESYVPAAPPEVTSAEYAASYNEVAALGGVDSTARTADQTEAGVFWAYDSGQGTPLVLFNDVLRTIAVQEGNTTAENAALFAHASVAMADAAIVAWDTKFDLEFWRPGTAIVDADLDGNTYTQGVSDWVALGAPDGGGDEIGLTPQFPTYISGHATFGGALFGTLQEFYGTDDIAFSLTSAELERLLDDPDLQGAYGLDLEDAERTFASLSEAMAENGRSRVYLGIHFDFDDLIGQEVGRDVAASINGQLFVTHGVTIPEPASAALILTGFALVQRRRRRAGA